MPTRVKICGITRWEDAQLAVELGASALGFNFYPPSPRFVAPETAKAIILKLPPLVTAVGVFANEIDGAHIAAIARDAGVTALQLHGPKFPKTDGTLAGFQIIRAVAVRDGMKVEDLTLSGTSAWLLDAFDSDLLGGTGKTFDWNLARDAKKYATIILAGGLTPENVSQAIRDARPYAVDVASGVESSPGKKDPAKLRAFFAAVANADKTL
ncbi:MAG: phosphoribosylanthranilate isomerase [Terriglobia bacterium]